MDRNVLNKYETKILYFILDFPTVSSKD